MLKYTFLTPELQFFYLYANLFVYKLHQSKFHMD